MEDMRRAEGIAFFKMTTLRTRLTRGVQRLMDDGAVHGDVHAVQGDQGEGRVGGEATAARQEVETLFQTETWHLRMG